MRPSATAVLLVMLLLPYVVPGQQERSAGDVANPVLLEAVAPTYPRSHFSNPARTVLVGLTVNRDGAPENVHIVRTGGERFDKNAIDTVSQYKFKPAVKAGHPVARDIQVEVNYKPSK